MKKTVLLLFLFLVSIVAEACPACNIHNYLYGSVYNSKRIYIGKVIELLDNNNVKVEVTRIIRNTDTMSLTVGDKRSEYVYNAPLTGTEIIFSYVKIGGLDLPILPIEYEWEIRYLADSTRKVNSVSEACTLLECVSGKSNKDGMEYIQEHYAESLDSLKNRCRKLRGNCEKDPNYFFGEHRLTNLAKALMITENDDILDFLTVEFNEILSQPHKNLAADSIPWRGTEPIGEYLRYLLSYSKKYPLLRDSLVKEYLNIIRKNDDPSIRFFAYAMTFEDVKTLIKTEASETQKNHITVGILGAAYNSRYYFQREEVRSLVNILKKYSDDPKVEKAIRKRLEGF